MTTSELVERRSNRIGWWVVAILSVLIAIVAVAPYATFNPDNFADIFDGRFQNGAHWLYLHAFASGIALLVGPFQFLKKLRDNRPSVHRTMGRIYLASIYVGGISGLIIAAETVAGVSGTVGFSLLALLWMYTATRALIAIRGGQVKHHQRWMIYNFALTFAAVTLRLYLGIGMAVLIGLLGFTPDMAFTEIYRTVPWLCWVPNLIVAQLIIDRLGLNPAALRPARKAMSPIETA